MNVFDVIQQNHDVYNAIASQFSSTRSFLWKDLLPLAVFARDGDRVLDLGCGNGRLRQLFNKKNISYVGLDQSEGLIAQARKKFPEVRFDIGEMRSLPFADSSFDSVYCVAAFHHLPDHVSQLACLKEIVRVLSPGGKVIMVNWNANGAWGKKKLETGKWKVVDEQLLMVPWKNAWGKILGERLYYAFTIEELENIFIQAGLIVEEQYYVKKGERSSLAEGENIVSILSTGDQTSDRAIPRHP